MSKIKKISINILLTFLSLFFLLLFLEFVVFRVILIAPDLPKVEFVDGLVKYKPNQSGVYRVRNEIKATYKINASGWNSAYDQYFVDKPANKLRIAIIGDSYVEATEVNFDESLAEKLEKKLGKDRYEAYRFGISGAPMSQYLHILRKEAGLYQPDLVVVILVHNDFDESYRFLRGTYASNFMKLKIEKKGSIVEIHPKKFIIPWYTPIRDSATWRYLAYRQQVPYHYLKDLILGNIPEYQANISSASLANIANNELVTNYVFNKMKEYCDNKKINLLIVINGVMEVVYNMVDKDSSYRTGALSLNVIAKRAAQQNHIDFIDLEPIFERDYKVIKKRFTFVNDGHWNDRGHQIVAKVIFEYIKKAHQDK